MRAALHDGTVIVNVIEYDPEADYTPPEELTLVELADDSHAWIGWTVAGDSFAPPITEESPPIVEESGTE